MDESQNPLVQHTTGEILSKEEKELRRVEPEERLRDVLFTYVGIRDQKGAIEKLLDKLKEDERMAREKLWDLMEKLNLDSFRDHDLGLISRSIYSTPYVANFEAFHIWIKETNNWQLLREEVRKTDLRSYIKEQDDNNSTEPIPPGIEIRYDKRISIRGGKGVYND